MSFLRQEEHPTKLFIRTCRWHEHTIRTFKAPKTCYRHAKKNTPKPQVANFIVPPEEITKKVNEVIAKYVDTSAINLNKLIDGSSMNHPNASNAIAIQDLVKGINGSGLKIT